MKLATPGQVLSARGITTGDGSLGIAASALELSYPLIEGILETALASGSTTDYFSCGTSCHQYRLTNAFIDESTIVVRVSEDGTPLLSPTAGAVLDSYLYVVDAVRGTIYLFFEPPDHDLSMSVTYEYGFPASDDDDDVLNVPQWLSSAHISMAVAYLLSSPANPAGRKEKALNVAAKEMYGAAKSALQAYHRPRMTINYPARSISGG